MPDATLKVSSKCDEMINKIKSETGATKKYIVENAIKIAYSEILKKGEK